MIKWLNQPAGQAKIIGCLTQDTLILLQPPRELLQGAGDALAVDISALVTIDSAGVAFLLELKDYGLKHGHKINFIGATESFNKLKSLYNLDTII